MDIIKNIDRYNSILKDVKVIKDGDSFYLKLIYEYENSEAIHKVTLPMVYLPACLQNIPDIKSTCFSSYGIQINQDVLPVIKGTVKTEYGSVKDVCIVDEIIKQKIHEMTVEEIEEKLGYPIKIISKGE